MAGGLFKFKRHKSRGLWKGHQSPPEVRRTNRVVSNGKAKASGRQFLWLVIFLLLGGGVFWFLFLSPVFRLTTVDITGNRHSAYCDIRVLADKQLSSKYLYLPQDNYWLFDKKSFKQALYDNFQLNDAQIKLRPTKLLIKLSEKDYTYIWQEGNLYYYINTVGDIILTKDSPVPDLLLINNPGPSLKQGRQIMIDPDYLDFANQLDQSLKNNSRGLSARQVVFDTTVRCLKIKLTAGPLLLFNTLASPSEQLNKLEHLRKNELRDGVIFNQQQYIDLRYSERIIYK